MSFTHIDAPRDHSLSFGLISEIELSNFTTKFFSMKFYKILKQSLTRNTMTNDIYCNQVVIFFFKYFLTQQSDRVFQRIKLLFPVSNPALPANKYLQFRSEHTLNPVIRSAYPVNQREYVSVPVFHFHRECCTVYYALVLQNSFCNHCKSTTRCGLP